MQGNAIGGFFKVILIVGLLLAGFYFIPWKSVKWGSLEFAPSSTISVSGYSESKEKNQIAKYSAGVNRVSDNKDEAISYINQKVEEIISSVKSFGVSSDDIKTQNISIYQQEETYWEEGRQKSRPGQWRVSNNVEITLRDVDRASELANLLTSSGATNVYGPNFSLDDTKKAETDLLQAAVEDAKTKAEILAESSGKKLGDIISINEGVVSSVVSMPIGDAGGGGGAPTQPGTGTVSKTVVVSFELK